jgi:hypothetical protein
MSVTKDSLAEMLKHQNPKYVEAVIGRALIVILENQTKDEQSAAETIEDNGIGFTGSDARTGTITAKYYQKHNKLEPWMVEKWVKIGKSGYPRICKYHKQLNVRAKQNEVR